MKTIKVNVAQDPHPVLYSWRFDGWPEPSKISGDARDLSFCKNMYFILFHVQSTVPPLLTHNPSVNDPNTSRELYRRHSSGSGRIIQSQWAYFWGNLSILLTWLHWRYPYPVVLLAQLGGMWWRSDDRSAGHDGHINKITCRDLTESNLQLGIHRKYREYMEFS